ncbi:hypothetical protein psal_cds_1378 [Pandoravirus salinus]|uniref:Nudix hydrolase domain-containing protein n=1 Tax=Pandoravirus salinus TaxID=1349410 RepID=S4VYK7_9VIRU|nr:hypothetical protein psal_cds_1378 [Pandoravirus salinus]AGO85784.1 hypothetical protein psal_cds_1378 [Pandoravirus salinus]
MEKRPRRPRPSTIIPAPTRMGPYAGVLPWARLPPSHGADRDGDDGNHSAAVVLLGQERYEPGWRDGGRWSDFGGGVEPAADRDEVAAAAREAYEETMGMLGSRDDIETALRDAAADGRLVEARSPKGAVVFLWEVPYDPMLPTQFARVYAYAQEAAAAATGDRRARREGAGFDAPKGYYEKINVAWVPVPVLVDAIEAALPAAEARAQGRTPSADPGILRDDFARTVIRFFDPLRP